MSLSVCPVSSFSRVFSVSFSLESSVPLSVESNLSLSSLSLCTAILLDTKASLEAINVFYFWCMSSSVTSPNSLVGTMQLLDMRFGTFSTCGLGVHTRYVLKSASTSSEKVYYNLKYTKIKSMACDGIT